MSGAAKTSSICSDIRRLMDLAAPGKFNSHEQFALDNALGEELTILGEKSGLMGSVLISFSRGRIAATSEGESEAWAAAMEKLGEKFIELISELFKYETVRPVPQGAGLRAAAGKEKES